MTGSASKTTIKPKTRLRFLLHFLRLVKRRLKQQIAVKNWASTEVDEIKNSSLTNENSSLFYAGKINTRTAESVIVTISAILHDIS